MAVVIEYTLDAEGGLLDYGAARPAPVEPKVDCRVHVAFKARV